MSYFHSCFDINCTVLIVSLYVYITMYKQYHVHQLVRLLSAFKPWRLSVSDWLHDHSLQFGERET